MVYTIYKTVNLINGKFYIGIHSTTDPDDSYLGSGDLIKKAIKKYGKNNFKKEILYVYENLDEALKKEKEIVTPLFIKDKANYNISIGGGIGGKHINGFSFEGRKHTKETKDKLSRFNTGRKTNFSEEGRKRHHENNVNNEERNKKISDALKGVKKSEIYKKNHSKAMKQYYKENPHKKGGRSNKGVPKKKIECPYCGKEGAPSNMSRWHFDNCKKK